MSLVVSDNKKSMLSAETCALNDTPRQTWFV